MPNLFSCLFNRKQRKAKGALNANLLRRIARKTAYKITHVEFTADEEAKKNGNIFV